MAEARKPFYKLVLERELASRLARNPQYSLRAFARTLSVDAGALSRLLTGKRTLSLRTAGRVATQLTLSGDERRLFLVSVAEDQKLRALSKAGPEPVPEDDDEPAADAEPAPQVALHLHAVLELARVDGSRADPRWIARRLGIAPHAARQAVEQLLALGLVVREGEGEAKRLVRTGRKLAPSDPRQVLARAREAFDDGEPERRAFAGLTMALDPELVPVARRAIQDFLDELGRALGAGERREVWQLGIQLFPLERRDRT